MSIVVRFHPSSLTKAQYDETTAKMQERGVDWPPQGLDYHVSFGSDGDLRVSEIWDSREQFEAFGEHLMPVLQEAGVELSGEPEVFEVHEITRR